MENGFEVAEPVVAEAYDLLFRIPGEPFLRAQVKTCRVRLDRNGAIVIHARKANGEPYTASDCDYLIGVLGDCVYLLQCRGLSEYWVTPENADVNWVLLNKEALH